MRTLDGIKWAADYVTSMADRHGEDVETETKVTYHRDGNPVTFGYIDAYFKNNLFDLKTGKERDYALQMCVYAAALCQRDDLRSVNAYLLYSETRSVGKMVVNREDAEAVVNEVIDKVEDPDKVPSVCGYCGWCEKKRVCYAVNPDRNLQALKRACEKNLGVLVDSFAKSMRMKERNSAQQHLKGLLSNINISIDKT